MIELVVRGAVSYLLGSVVAGLVIGRLCGVDIRATGSGNAGATNAMRALGKKIALIVFVIDFAKGWVAAAVIATYPWPMAAGSAAADTLSGWSVPVCALAVMLGHVYPLWYGFRGGKGMATLLGCVSAIAAWLLVPMILTWLLTVALTGFVGLGSLLAAIALAVAIAASGMAAPLIAFGVSAAVLVLYTHRSNIARMLAGTESRARRLWLFGTRRA